MTPISLADLADYAAIMATRPFCHVCDKIGIQFAGRDERICDHGGEADSPSAFDPRILNAYDFARSARFEHGET
jgi:hypothetical protein